MITLSSKPLGNFTSCSGCRDGKVTHTILLDGEDSHHLIPLCDDCLVILSGLTWAAVTKYQPRGEEAGAETVASALPKGTLDD